jgi:hypothetical protein
MVENNKKMGHHHLQRGDFRLGSNLAAVSIPYLPPERRGGESAESESEICCYATAIGLKVRGPLQLPCKRCGPEICCKRLADFFLIRNIPKACDSHKPDFFLFLIGKHVPMLFIFARYFFAPQMTTFDPATVCVTYSHGCSLF